MEKLKNKIVAKGQTEAGVLINVLLIKKKSVLLECHLVSSHVFYFFPQVSGGGASSAASNHARKSRGGESESERKHPTSRSNARNKSAKELGVQSLLLGSAMS